MPTTISMTPWSKFSEADYTLEQWIRACLIHPQKPTTSKGDYKLPVREPDGTLNKNAIHAVAGVLAGARGGVKASPSQIRAAARKLIGLYATLNADPPASVKMLVHSELNDVLEHFGVKGMKWGVRKNYRDLRNAPRKSVTVKAKNGDTVVAVQQKMPVIGASIGAMSSRYREKLNNSMLLDMKVNGRNVGDVAFVKKSKEEVNFGWIGVKPKERGKGYATAVFDAGVKYARKEGFSKITLEVPGNAPDARHIYEKFGFKPTGEHLGHTGDMWGGLTVMAYDIPKTSTVRHAETLDDEFERAITMHFGAMGIDEIMFGNDATHSETTGVDDVLEHFGVKGMHWGVRRSRLPSSSDAARVNSSKKIAKKSGTDALSTKDLQELVTRMNLEQQYSRMTSKPGPIKRGLNFTNGVLSAGNTVNQAIQFTNSPSGKFLRSQIEEKIKSRASG